MDDKSNHIVYVRNMAIFQFDMAWELLKYNLNGLDDEICLWQPGERGLHVHKRDGAWYADWPGSADAVKNKISQLHDRWKTVLETMSDEDFISHTRTKWPFEDKPFYELAAWLNLELIKNASEIGYCRFLYASQK